MAISTPDGYTSPPFPSLNFHHLRDRTPSGQWTLVHLTDIWRFTLVWTLIFFAAFHVGAAALAVLTVARGGGGGRKRRSVLRYVWAVPALYVLAAGVEALFAGSVVGLILGAVYRAGEFNMSTAIPFVWGLINVLVLVISSFTMQGGL